MFSSCRTLVRYYKHTQFLHTDVTNTTNCRVKSDSAQVNLWHLETYLMLSYLLLQFYCLSHGKETLLYVDATYFNRASMKFYYPK